MGIECYAFGNSFTPSSSGSGIIMTADGYIVTNAHVVEDAAGITVVLENGDAYAAELIGADSDTDLAVLKIEASNLTYAEFGNSDELERGDRVIAIGNPGAMILAEVGDFSNFASADKLLAYAGLSPSTYQSG